MNEPNRYRIESDEVFFVEDPIALVTASDISFLKAKAETNARLRSRLCYHRSPNDLVHEMLIVHHRDVYVRPHRHRGKTESLQVLEGDVTAVMLGESGGIERAVEMGMRESGKPFSYRMPELVWHTLLIRSEWLVFLEVTQGPFSRTQSEFAPWAPIGSDPAEVREYEGVLNRQIRDLRSTFIA